MIQTCEVNLTESMLKPTPDVQQDDAQGECELTLASLFDAEETPLLRYAFSLTGRRAVAEEIVQDVFLQLHSHWDRVETPKAWLFRCVRNKAYRHLRDHKREVQSDGACDAGCHDMDLESPEQSILRMETTGLLRQTLGQLDANDRRLIQLKYFDGLKYSDIASKTGLSVGNVGYRLHHILKKLASDLRPLGVDASS